MLAALNDASRAGSDSRDGINTAMSWSRIGRHRPSRSTRHSSAIARQTTPATSAASRSLIAPTDTDRGWGPPTTMTGTGRSGSASRTGANGTYLGCRPGSPSPISSAKVAFTHSTIPGTDRKLVTSRCGSGAIAASASA